MTVRDILNQSVSEGLSLDTWFDTLEYYEVYCYYDGPLLWSSIHPISGEKYLFSFAEREKWLLVKISDEKLIALRDGHVQLRDAFLKAEDGYCYIFDSATNTAIKYPCEELPTIYLSDEGVYLDGTENLP